jgi:hypothetical protein
MLRPILTTSPSQHSPGSGPHGPTPLCHTHAPNFVIIAALACCGARGGVAGRWDVSEAGCGQRASQARG